MVEGTGLENRHTGNGIVSSNLTLSAGVAARRRGSPRRRVLLKGVPGWVAEWFKAHAWKACWRESVSGVRIPPHPLLHRA